MVRSISSPNSQDTSSRIAARPATDSACLVRDPFFTHDRVFRISAIYPFVIGFSDFLLHGSASGLLVAQRLDRIEAAALRAG